jgi:hypothetical protein
MFECEKILVDRWNDKKRKRDELKSRVFIFNHDKELRTCQKDFFHQLGSILMCLPIEICMIFDIYISMFIVQILGFFISLFSALFSRCQICNDQLRKATCIENNLFFRTV